MRQNQRSLLVAVLMLVTILSGFTATTPNPVAATHNRASQLSWVRATGTTANFYYTASYRGSYFGSPVVGATITDATVCFGDGVCETPDLTVIAVDTANDVIMVEGNFSHVYASAGPFTAYAEGCCRLSGSSGHINNPDDTFRVETIVDFAGTTASPRSTIPPIVDCPLNATCTFSVPAVDPDGQGLRFRLASAAEAGGAFVQPGSPHAPNNATISAMTGIYSWNTTGATLAASGDTFYSTQVVVENVVGTTVVSKIGVDFFIRLTDQTSTNQPPVFVSPTPPDGTVYNVTVGQSVLFNVQATDPDAGDTVTLGIIGKPTDATFTSTPGNPATGSFSFTPTAPGSYAMNLTAQDQTGRGAVPRSITINVTLGGGEAHLTLIKTVDNTGGGTAAATDWTLSATGPTNISGRSGDASITNATVNPGTYTLAEAGGPSDYSPSAWSCTGGTLTGSSLVLAAGATASCSITNTFIPPNPAHLTLTKTVDNTGGGTALATAWTLTATGPTTISGHTGDAAITNAAVSPGTYTLSEAGGPSDYSPSAWSCTGGTLTGSSLVLAAGATASCSINNTFAPSSPATYVSILLDRSGSMARNRTIRAYNQWLADEQQALPQARATLALFNSCAYRQRGASDRLITELHKLTRESYKPRCNTPLYDAIARTINRAARDPLSAGHVVIAIYTDGRENASTHWTRHMLNGLIAGKVAQGWTFVWLGNSLDPLVQEWAGLQ